MNTTLSVAQITNSSSNQEDARRAARAERLACIKWTSIIVTLLGGSVGMWIYAAVLAVSDPSMAVVPDYHEKALHWDDHLASQAASDRLGWTIAIVPSRNPSSNGTRELLFFVRDRNEKPVTGAQGELRLYHHARAGQAESVSLKETDPGTYACDVHMNRAGTWQIELTMHRQDDRLEHSTTYDLSDLLVN